MNFAFHGAALLLLLIAATAMIVRPDSLRSLLWKYGAAIGATIIPAMVVASRAAFRRRVAGFRPDFYTFPYLYRAGMDSGSMAFMVGGVAVALLGITGLGSSLGGDSALTAAAMIGFAAVALVSPSRWANAMLESSGTSRRFTHPFSSPGQADDASLQLVATAILVIVAATRPADAVLPVLLEMAVVLVGHIIGVHLFTIFILPDRPFSDVGTEASA